ncbi:hypothetical protein EGW08_019566 [Elysia chlorotica]|uniref:Alpha-2-macroglobulin RAP C-terminal domain-containing protein n=1 Tax=Elysia chlorotica TaxID=188477 RepID=A0A433STQ4_ELYCH|nr:hypothetical protein EGW08_019566 [Elysia chlorotica]
MRALILSSIICVLIIYTNASKYSKSANDDIDYEREEKPFRMKKVNLLWTKGKKKLSSRKLADLYAELSVHDKYEAHLKKIRAANKDEDGTLEAKVMKSYALIVDHFGLDDSLPSGKNKHINEIPFEEEEYTGKEIQFQDRKLQSMWRKAQESGFSQSDLQMLREEFQHQQIKVNELNFLMAELGADPDLLEDADPYENVVWPDIKMKEQLSEEKLKESNVTLKLKENHGKVKAGYQKLEDLISSVGVPEPVFTDDRINNLWAMAKKTDWSMNELNSFKEELKHFEHRLSKLSYYKDQLDGSEDAITRMKEKGLEIPEKHQKLMEKNEFLDRTVNKLYTDLKSRINKSLKHLEF